MFDLTSSPSAHMEVSLFEIVLAHCITKTGKEDYVAAMRYGRNIGYFDADGLLTISGKSFAQFSDINLETAA
tara:strand:- start:232 stop:447 length:216 start_codon:yes stop_codon:yes gene_type:complete